MNIVRKVLTLAYDPKYQIYIYIYTIESKRRNKINKFN